MPLIRHVDPETRVRIAQLRQMLARGPMSVEALMHAFSVSQPTLSRMLTSAGLDVQRMRITGDRTPRYGILRFVAGSATPKSVYRVTPDGQFVPYATMSFLQSGHTHVALQSGRTLLYEGLPPSMTFASPSGFLGRQVAAEAVQHIDVPSSIRDWSDAHKTEYLFNLAHDAPGDLVFGEASLERAMQRRDDSFVVPTKGKLARYAALTTDAAAQAAGSSAGGEQPKFLCETEEHGHVIVKFARQGSRMASLLFLEHLALESLAHHGIPAAKTRLLQHGGISFLEVQRFDRVGRFGRRGMLSAGAFDDEHFGHRDSWSAFAERCVAQRVMSEPLAKVAHVLAAFSELIGNTDTHFENLALLIDHEGEVEEVAPAYDMLPMRYATVGGGIDPDLTPLSPKLGAHMGHLDAWQKAHEAASHFWRQVAAAKDSEFQALAVENGRAIDAFVQPMLSARPVHTTAPSARKGRRTG